MLQTLKNWHKWIETWYLAYALMGIPVAGLTPVLVPLTVGRSSGSIQVGGVMAAISLGGLTAPLWGRLADRYRLHRWLLVAGLFVAAIGLAGFPFSTRPTVWFILALLQGIGAASAATVANLFVVESHPKAEWDERIGWLQTFYGVGQVVGLLLASLLSKIDIRIALLVSAGFCIISLILGLLTTKTPQHIEGLNPVLTHPVRHGEWTINSPQRLFHNLDRKAIKYLNSSFRSPFGLFLIVWLLTFGGAAAIFSQYPLLMQKLFGVSPSLSSVGFAVAAGLGLTLYNPAGAWSDKAGAARVLRIAFGIRLLAFLGLLLFGLSTRPSGLGWLAMIFFGLVVCAWSLISVSSTSLAANISPGGEGEAMGLYNAMTALAGVLGAVLGGWVAGIWSYNAMLALSVAGVAAGLALSTGVNLSAGRRKGPPNLNL
jgi:DHA1 family tetracycline resistance protein-like MFS transporter